MKTFALVDSQGYVTSITSSRERPGNEWIEYPNDGPRLGVTKVKMVGGQPQVTDESFAPTPGYDLQRVRAYPSIGDQLDMLWHAMDRQEIPRVEPFYGAIKAVKSAYPKTPPA